MKSIGLILFLFLCTPLFAQDFQKHGPSLEALQKMADHNSSQSLLNFSEVFSSAQENNSISPFFEYDETGYLFMSDGDYYGIAKEMKDIIARELPTETTLVVYTTSTNSSYQNKLFKRYSQLASPEQVKILQVPSSGSNNFWTRDNLPIPAWDNGDFTLVDAQYYYNFEPDQFLSQLFGAKLIDHNYFFEGGNFMANSRGECIVVNRKKAYPGGVSDTAAIPDSVFANKYGCKSLLRFKHLKGIGHADEVIKFMSDDIVVTDTHQYVQKLEDAGYTVHLLPEPDRNYETYANSLQVNDTLFVPVFGESGDKKAIEVYESLNLGLKIVPIPSRRLATQGQGGIHCITMNYPKVPLQKLASDLGGKIIEQ